MTRQVRQNAGVIGLGIIGSRAAANLRRAGFQTWVWNRTPRPEPNFLSSPSEVAESSKIIQIFVSDGPALTECLRSMAPALGPEHIVLNHATVSPKETLEAARIVEERHAKYLDAPCTGSRDAATNGQLVFFVGGDSAALEKARAHLVANSKAVLRIGEIGQAAAMKVALSLISAVAASSLAEAMCLLDKSGIPLYKLGVALRHHLTFSPFVELKLPPMIKGDFDPRLSLKHMFKDVQIALSMADESKVELPAASAFAGAAMAGIQSGWADLDFTSIAKHYGYPNEENDIPVTVFSSSPETPEKGKETPEAKAPDEGKEKKRMFPIFGFSR